LPYLGEPDSELGWLKERVDEAWTQWQADKAAERERRLDRGKDVPLDVPEVPESLLLEQALRHHEERRKVDRMWQPRTRAVQAWNYFRHVLSPYDAQLNGCGDAGYAGFETAHARLTLRDRLLRIFGSRYPKLFKGLVGAPYVEGMTMNKEWLDLPTQIPPKGKPYGYYYDHPEIPSTIEDDAEP